MGKPSSNSYPNRDSFLQGLSSEWYRATDGQPGTLDTDWQLDSVLLIAQNVHTAISTQTDIPIQTSDLLCRLISKFISAAKLYYATGINELKLGQSDPTLRTDFNGAGVLSERQPRRARRRTIMEDISSEWSRLSALIGSAQLLRADDPAVRVLQAAFLVARQDLRIFEDRKDWKKPDFVVLPHVGRHFELVSFNYEPSIFVLGVPMGSLYCPWEWPLIWHEMAGIYVRKHAADPGSVIGGLAEKLRELVRREGLWDAWRGAFGDDLKRLPMEDGHLAPSVIDGWAQELTEDSAGLLCLGTSMLFALENALRLVYEDDETDEGKESADLVLTAPEPDTRHPPMELRLTFARSLLFIRDHEVADPDAPAGIADLAKIIWSRRSEIVTAPLDPADERKLIDVLNVLTQGADLDASKYAGLKADDKDASASADNATKVRLLVAGASLAFGGHLSPGDQIRKRIYGERTAPSTIEAFEFDEDTQKLLRRALSVSDQLFISSQNVQCDGHNLKVTLKGTCPIHATAMNDTRVTLSHT
jgi:hypothetical protein